MLDFLLSQTLSNAEVLQMEGRLLQGLCYDYRANLFLLKNRRIVSDFQQNLPAMFLSISQEFHLKVKNWSSPNSALKWFPKDFLSNPESLQETKCTNSNFHGRKERKRNSQQL